MSIMGVAASTRPRRSGGGAVQLRLVRTGPERTDAYDGQPAADGEPAADVCVDRGAEDSSSEDSSSVDARRARPQEDQITDLFRQHAAALTRLAGLLTSDRSAAEEVVQDAFVGLHRKFGDIRDPSLALAYLRTSVVNGSRSKLRRRRTERAHIPPYLPPASSAEEGALAREEHAQVRAGMTKLPRRQREVLILRYHLDLSEAEIAATLGISRGAVKAYASRALAALGAHLEESR